MAVFIGDDKNSTAARAGLKINYAVLKIINPAVRSQYPKSRYEVQHHVGIDSCELFVARTGIRERTTWCGLERLPTTRPNSLRGQAQQHR